MGIRFGQAAKRLINIDKTSYPHFVAKDFHETAGFFVVKFLLEHGPHRLLKNRGSKEKIQKNEEPTTRRSTVTQAFSNTSMSGNRSSLDILCIKT